MTAYVEAGASFVYAGIATIPYLALDSTPPPPPQPHLPHPSAFTLIGRCLCLCLIYTLGREVQTCGDPYFPSV